MPASEEGPFQLSGTEYKPSDEDNPWPSRIARLNLLDSKSKSKRVVKKKRKDSPSTKGKKRIRSPEKWQRNVRRRKKAQGEMHTSAKGMLVWPRSIGATCKCRLQCFELIGDEKIRKLFEEFNKISDKQKQDIYLAGLILPQNVARRRGQAGKEKEISFKYKVRINGQEYPVYKNALWSIHGVSKFRIENVAKSLNYNVLPQPDMRGRHLNRPNRIPDNIIRCRRPHKKFPATIFPL